MQAEESMREGFNQMFFSDGTGNSSKNWNGLGNLVSTSAIAGGIDPAGTGNSFWQSYADTATEALTLAKMATAYNTTSVGNDHPDFILSSQTLFEKYESLLQPQLRYTDTKTADAGFQNLLFKAAPVMYDVHCSAGTMFFLNSKYITLVGHNAKWFQQTEFIRPEDLDARYALIMCYGNLTIRNRKKQGKLTNKS